MTQLKRLNVYSIKDLSIGDRFYKATDKKKILYTKVEGETQKTYYQTYKHFGLPDGRKHKELFKSDTQVIFLRNSNE